MAALSKYYSDILKNNKVTCEYVLHPGTSCTSFLLKTLPITFFRTSQFFIPLYFLPALANTKNLSKEKIYDVVQVFVSSVMTGGATVYMAYLMICLLSNITGTTSFWRLIPIPGIFGGLAIFTANDKVHGFFTHAISIVCFDMLVRDGTIWPLRMLKNYRSIRTLLFMILSGIIVDTMYLNSESVFWLFKPLKKYRKSVDGQPNESNQPLGANQICHHKNCCKSHTLQVFKTYLMLGMALEMLKFVFRNFASILKNPLSLFYAIKHIKPNFLLFITGYPTLSNLINCLLNQWFQKSTRLNQDIAAVIGGIPFYFCANELPIIAHTFITTLESIWHRYKKYSNPETNTYKYLTKIPVGKLVYIFGGSFMYTSRLFFPWLAPKFLQRLMMLITDCKLDDIGERVHSIWLPEVII